MSEAELLCTDGAASVLRWDFGPKTQGARGEYSGLTALTFVLPDLTIELEITPEVVQGQVVPARSRSIRLERCDGTTVEGKVDVDGWFRLGPPPEGGFRLELDGADGGSVRTPWVGR